jgi:hypothetical protein
MPLDDLELRLVDFLVAIYGGATAQEALAANPERIDCLGRRLRHLKLSGALSQVAPTQTNP